MEAGSASTGGWAQVVRVARLLAQFGKIVALITLGLHAAILLIIVARHPGAIIEKEHRFLRSLERRLSEEQQPRQPQPSPSPVAQKDVTGPGESGEGGTPSVPRGTVPGGGADDTVPGSGGGLITPDFTEEGLWFIISIITAILFVLFLVSPWTYTVTQWRLVASCSWGGGILSFLGCLLQLIWAIIVTIVTVILTILLVLLVLTDLVSAVKWLKDL